MMKNCFLGIVAKENGCCLDMYIGVSTRKYVYGKIMSDTYSRTFIRVKKSDTEHVTQTVNDLQSNLTNATYRQIVVPYNWVDNDPRIKIYSSFSNRRIKKAIQIHLQELQNNYIWSLVSSHPFPS